MDKRTVGSLTAVALAVLAVFLAILQGCRPDRARAPWDEITDKIQFIDNPSFEETEDGTPMGWKAAVWRKEGEFRVSSVARTGERSIMISSETGGDLAWTTIVPIRPFARYRLSGWIRTEDVWPVEDGKGALLNIHGVTPWQTGAVTGTIDWTKVSLEFDAGANDTLQVNCLFGGWGKATGKACYDDIRLELLAARKIKPTAIVNAAKTLHPISPYIYGQFIEHLGHCIYRGLWAEMLEDRKFFYPVGREESPWKVIGDPKQITMDRKQPFTGVHSPRVNLQGNKPAGIYQEGLALIKGKEYTGRIVLAGAPETTSVKCSLVWGEGNEERQTMEIGNIRRDFQTFPLSFEAGASTDVAHIEITSEGLGYFRIGAISLMPGDNIEGFRSDTIALLRELDSPIYRWPGGNFVSGYNWRDGIGDRDRRPPRKNPAWLGVEHNDVGIHEFMDLCRLIDTEPFIVVNSGLGDVKRAVEMLEYVNGAPDTPMGKLRAQNGHPEPWDCIYWGIGNEMYGNWQLGHMPLANYVKKHNEFAGAMRAKDQRIKLVAVGAVGSWSQTMLTECADHMDFISEHFYCGEKLGLLSHVSQIPYHIRRIAEAHRQYRKTISALQDKDIRIVLDEWNYWYGPYIYGELGTQYFLKDALGIAAGIHEYVRQSDIIFMANYAQTVNVIGAIKTSKTEAAFDTTGLVLKLFRHHFGTTPVDVEGAPEPLDVMAAWTEKMDALTISVLNPMDAEQKLKLELVGVKMPKTSKLYRIAGTDPKACNVPGKPPQVAIEETDRMPFGKTLILPPLSISLYVIERSHR